ncbi:MAG TPA: AAA family ATPase [Candidatus Binatia bacterium]|nr:AAA family ATPase [Candidatus Binatia bacterium]
MIELVNSDQHKTSFESYFGFRETPFGVTPDPRFFYGNPLYLDGLSALTYGIEGKKGFMLLTGEVGTGKTILLRKVMRQLEANVQFVFVSTSHLTSYGLVELIIQDLGITNAERNRLDMMHELKEYLIEQNKAGQTVALLLDEAQNLNDEALEGLCGLSNLETAEQKLLQIVLVGQPELAIKLGKSSLRRIKQRIAIHYRLHALQTVNEVEQYIRHRLQVAGYTGPEIFAKEAAEAIWYYSSGTPRLVNIICDNSLAMACAAGKKKVSAYTVMKAASGLLLERGHAIPKIGVSEPPAKAKTPAAKLSAKRSETNGAEVKARRGLEAPTASPSAAPPEAASETDSKEAPVPQEFLDFMTRAAIQAMGPMAQLVVSDQISALGESRDAFPEVRIGELIELVSREILNEAMRVRFQNEMFREIAALKNL